MHFLTRTSAWLTIMLGLLNAWRAITQFTQRGVLIDYAATLPIGLLASISAIWSILMIGGGLFAWRKPHKLKLLIPLLFLTYTLYNLWLPTETLPSLYGHVFMIIFTWIGLRKRGINTNGMNKSNRKKTNSELQNS